MYTILTIVIFLALAAPLVTSTVYGSFLDSRIKDKKAMLSFLESACTGAFYAFMVCFGINLAIFLVVEFATTIEFRGMALVPMGLIFVYLTFLSIPHKLISCLKTSIEEEETAGKSTSCNSEGAEQ